MTEELVNFVMSQEGWRAKAYLDQVGLPTIGYGFRVPTLNVPDMTPEEGERKLRSWLASIEAWVLRTSPILKTSQRRLSAVIDFCFNCGETAYQGSTMRKRIDAGEWAFAAEEMRKWVKGTKNGVKVVIPALVRRRNITSRWLETG